jgi:hypothetical protein
VRRKRSSEVIILILWVPVVYPSARPSSVEGVRHYSLALESSQSSQKILHQNSFFLSSSPPLALDGQPIHLWYWTVFHWPSFFFIGSIARAYLVPIVTRQAQRKLQWHWFSCCGASKSLVLEIPFSLSLSLSLSFSFFLSLSLSLCRHIPAQQYDATDPCRSADIPIHCQMTALASKITAKALTKIQCAFSFLPNVDTKSIGIGGKQIRVGFWLFLAYNVAS